MGPENQHDQPECNTATDNLRTNPYEIASELDADEWDAEFRREQKARLVRGQGETK